MNDEMHRMEERRWWGGEDISDEHKKVGEVKRFFKMNLRKKDERNISTESYQQQVIIAALRKFDSGTRNQQEWQWKAKWPL